MLFILVLGLVLVIIIIIITIIITIITIIIIIIIMAGVVMPSETEFWQGVSLTRVKLAEEQDQPGTNRRNTNKPKNQKTEQKSNIE